MEVKKSSTILHRGVTPRCRPGWDRLKSLAILSDLCFSDFILSDLFVFKIARSAIYMFFRFHPQRFIYFFDFNPCRALCFSYLILSDLYVFPISSSAIYMFFREPPQRFICFSDFIFSDLCFSDFNLRALYVFPTSSSAIYMFFRFHPQRFICLKESPLSDLYVFTISSSAI